MSEQKKTAKHVVKKIALSLVIEITVGVIVGLVALYWGFGQMAPAETTPADLNHSETDVPDNVPPEPIVVPTIDCHSYNLSKELLMKLPADIQLWKQICLADKGTWVETDSETGCQNYRKTTNYDCNAQNVKLAFQICDFMKAKSVCDNSISYLGCVCI